MPSTKSNKLSRKVGWQPSFIPARSARFSLDTVDEPSVCFCVILSINTECERDEAAFIWVCATDRHLSPISITLSASSCATHILVSDCTTKASEYKYYPQLMTRTALTSLQPIHLCWAFRAVLELCCQDSTGREFLHNKSPKMSTVLTPVSRLN